MKIMGIDRAVLAVEEMDDAKRFLQDFGLTEVELGTAGSNFETLNGTDVVLRGANDAGLPAAVGPLAGIRETIWGVSDAAELQKIGNELSRDRQVTQGNDGVLRSTDATGYGIGFQVTTRHHFDAPLAAVNTCGQAPQRPRNSRIDFKAPLRPRSLGHVVLYVPDLEAATRFYIDRLGFRLSDSYRGHSTFLRAAGSNDHHNIFLFKKDDVPGGLHHLEFHVTDFNEVMVGGQRLADKGWQTAFGPGRHILGSNYFWYFKTPCGGAMELAADMDFCDDDWVAGEYDFSPDMVAGWTTTYGKFGH